MKWLQANPLGIGLAAVSGVLVLFALVMAVLWSLPVSVRTDAAAGVDDSAADLVVKASKLEPLREYEVINQRPIFNQTRLPVIEEEIEEIVEEETADTTIAVADAPDVKLTGILIAPGMKLASLTPNDASIDSVTAYEGDSLTGAFVGWRVGKVRPRQVELNSLDGQTLQLELEVHKAKIQQPPKPVAQAKPQTSVAKQTESVEAALAGGEEDEPLSRAEQIRQRIAERREELRREQESQQQGGNNQPQANAATAKSANPYQDAIRRKMNRSRDTKSEDSKDG